MGHAQVVEDKPGIEGKIAHHRSDGLVALLEGLEDADGEAAKSGDVLGAEAGSDSAAVLIVVPVDDVVDAFDTPVAAVHFQDPLGRCLLRGAAGDSQGDIQAVLAGFFVEGLAFDQENLPDVGEVEVGIEFCAAPNTPCFDTSVIGCESSV